MSLSSCASKNWNQNCQSARKYRMMNMGTYRVSVLLDLGVESRDGRIGGVKLVKLGGAALLNFEGAQGSIGIHRQV
jgi:hypothetical protein